MITKSALVGFLLEEDGAVTVDWVVLSAAVVTLAIVVYTTVQSGTGALSGKIRDNLSNQTLATF